jgi:hypothetical protein
MIPARLRKLVTADEEKLGREIAEFEAERVRLKGLRLAEDEHHYFESQRKVWRAMVRKYVGYRLPDAIQAPAMRLVVDAWVASSDEFARDVHDHIDALAAEGTVLDPTPAAEVAKRLAQIDGQIADRKIALRRRQQEARRDAEQSALDAIDAEARGEALES